MDILTPNAVVPESKSRLIIAGWLVGWVATWFVFHPVVLPSPIEVVTALPELWSEYGLGAELITSFILSIKALLLSSAIALPLAWLSRVPIIKPVSVGLAKLRFLSPAVFYLMLVFMTSTGSQVKLWMLTLGETFFLLTSMMTVVNNIPSEQYDDALTLRMNEWQVTYYVAIRSTVDAAIECVRDNAAMGWGMLMMVEGIVRSDGGVGVLLISQEKFFNYASVYAIAGVILAVGMLQDAGLTWLRRAACPWVSLR